MASNSAPRPDFIVHHKPEQVIPAEIRLEVFVPSSIYFHENRGFESDSRNKLSGNPAEFRKLRDAIDGALAELGDLRK